MDRRAAGALLALAACFACSAAAPTASNHTALDLYEGASDGCYYNFQHYGEGDRIMTNEPCLNCTCHNRMLMCYLRVCPFTKPIGQDCTVEKRADQCCPIVTCPDVPVDLLTSTSTSSPAEYGATGLGKLDKYGCSINGKYFPEGSKVPPTPNKPCEHCYCIRNMTTCVMQECTLHVDGCTPIYHKDVCCPIRYSCDHAEDEVPLLDDMSTTVRPTPGFLLTTTTLSPVTQMSQDCVHNDQVIADGASITTEKACEHCYCMKGDIVCVVQECGAPMENEGKNCTSLPPREGQCCPDTYICEGDELSTEMLNESATESFIEKQTTLLPPRRTGAEGSGYRNEPNESSYTGIPTIDSELEGSGEEPEPTKTPEEYEAFTSVKPLETEEIATSVEDSDLYIPVTTKEPSYQDTDITKKEPNPPKEEIDEITSEVTQSANLPHEHVTLANTPVQDSYQQSTTESIESLNTVPDQSLEKEQEMSHENIPMSTPTSYGTKPAEPQESEDTKSSEKDITINPTTELTFNSEGTTLGLENVDTDIKTTEKSVIIPEQVTLRETEKSESDIGTTTGAYAISEDLETVINNQITNEKETIKPEDNILSTTNTPLAEMEKLTTELNVAQNTVIATEEESRHPPLMPSEEIEMEDKVPELESTEKTPKHTSEPVEEEATTVPSVLKESESTDEPDKGLNTIPNEIDELSQSHASEMEATISPVEVKTTILPDILDSTTTYDIQKSSVTTESSSMVPESHVTKGEQHTVTTEPSFRKEDESNISTDKTKDELGSTTMKPEFIDEELIPTSSQEEKLTPGPDSPSTDEEFTTMVPEDIKEPEETISHEPSATAEPIQETSVISDKGGETVSEPEDSLLHSTEKSTAAHTLLPEVDAQEEPSRIPGEGDCLLNGVTYRNNTIVPNTSNCHTGCKCVSSIIKCDPIICSPPPDYMSNCQSIFDTPDSCCPTYICDHLRETIPPQSDNQMSETEPPLASPTIECRGDQCELTVPNKPTEPTEHCVSGNCLSTPTDKTSTDKCGPEGCGDILKEPGSLQPSDDRSGCSDGKCETSKDDCVNGKCKELATDIQQSPINTCIGDDCSAHSDEILVPQLCKEGQECNKTEIPIIKPTPGINCEGSICESSVTAPPEQQLCDGKDGCKAEEIVPTDCSEEKPCRRQESPITEQLPSDCKGEECVLKTDSPLGENTSLTTDKIPLTAVTEKITTVDENKLPESTDSQLYTTPVVQPISEQTEKIFEMEKEVLTEEPDVIEEEDTKNPDVLDNYTTSPISTKETQTVQNTGDIQTTPVPESVKEDHTEEISSQAEEEEPQKLDESDKEETTKQTVAEVEVTQKPDITDEYTPKPTEESENVKEHFDKTTTLEEFITKTPDVTREYFDSSTQMPNVDDQTMPESGTKGQNIDDEVTKAPDNSEEHETDIPDITEKQPGSEATSVREEDASVSSVTKEYSDNLTEMPETDISKVTLASTIIPEALEKHTTESDSIMDKDTIVTDYTTKYTDKPSSPEDHNLEIPSSTEKQYEENIPSDEDNQTEIPKATETADNIENTSTLEQLSTKAPGDIEEQNYVPVIVTEEGTKAPDFESEKDRTGIPTLVKEDETKTPDIIEKETDEKIPAVEEESTKKPQTIDDLEDESTKIPDKEHTGHTTTIPDSANAQTDESTRVPDSDTKTPDLQDNAYVPDVIIDETTNMPQYGEGDLYQTSAPEELDVTVSQDDLQNTIIPDDKKDKPILVEEELPEKPSDMKETDEKKPDFIEKEGITEPVITEESSTEVVEDNTKKPIWTEDGTSSDIEGHTTEVPFVTKEINTDKPLVGNEIEEKPLVDEKSTEGPITEKDDTSDSLDTEHTSKPNVYEEHTKEPDLTITKLHESQIPDVVEAGTKAPEIYVTETEKEIKLPESMTEEHTKPTSIETEKSTQAPTYQTKITETEESVEPESVTSAIMPEETSKAPEEHGPQGISTVLPIGEITTKQPLRESDQTTYQPSMHVTTPREQVVGENEAVEIPETIMTTESTEQDTGISEEKLPTTKTPSAVTAEPQEIEYSKSPDITQISETEEGTTLKPFEEENFKSSIPESYVTELTPENEGTDRVTEVLNTELHHVSDTTPHDTYSPEKEEMIPTAMDATGTSTPVKDFTESGDVLSAGEELTSTKHSEDATEQQSTTEKLDESSETSSKITIAPETSHIGYTEIPIDKETISSESNEISTTPKPSELLPETTAFDKGVTQEPHRRTEIGDLDKTTLTSETHHITELPLDLDTIPESVPTTDEFAVSEEKSTKKPDVTAEIYPDLSTIEPHVHTSSEPTATKVQKPVSEPELISTTVSSYSGPHITGDQGIDTTSQEQEAGDNQISTVIPDLPLKPESDTQNPAIKPEEQNSSTDHPTTTMEMLTEIAHTQITEAPLSLITKPDASTTTGKYEDTNPILPGGEIEVTKQTTEKEDISISLHETTTAKEMDITKPTERTSEQIEFSETTPYLIELEEHTHKIIDEVSTISSSNEKESTYEAEEEVSTPSISKEEDTGVHEDTKPSTVEEEHIFKTQETSSTVSTPLADYTNKLSEDTSSVTPLVDEVTTKTEMGDIEKVTEKIPEGDYETATKLSQTPTVTSEETSTVSDIANYQTTLSEPKETNVEVKPGQAPEEPAISENSGISENDITTPKIKDLEGTTPAFVRDTPPDTKIPTKEEPSKAPTTIADESFSTTKATTLKQEELLTPSLEDKYSTPELRPTSETVSSSTTAEIPKPSTEIEPPEEIPSAEEDGLSPSGGYGEPDYAEEDQAFGPGTCRYGGKVYVSAQQIPRDDPCDFCFCFRSDIICLQQSCPPPIHGCHEEPIQGFCCPRYECPVSMATTVNVTTTTTTTTTTLPPHFPTHGYKGAAQRRGCQIKGHTYKVGEVVRSSSGPCLHCTCGGDGQMKCDPKACTPEPMLRQMIAAAVSAKRRR